MEVRTYDDMEIEIVQCSENYEELLSIACNMTMRRIITAKTISSTLINFLINSGHTSVFEHLIVTIRTTGISRSLLAQLTRHRMMSPTSASQHYQNYKNWPIVISPFENSETRDYIIKACKNAYLQYENLLRAGAPKEEARQVLPNAATVNMLMTWNARSLLNFFEQRCCNRNVDEMRIFANTFRSLMRQKWPLVMKHAGPPCTTKECNQGHMQCKEKVWTKV